ncbi:MAG TPA: protein-L-isoaspartate(D-aspartate) O-methyltransferase, partial [Propylenella sp.]|nr:protein-L-isoaspartate(D-aspartate) O-methyltransferase [Propylenella sp.]
MTDRYEAERGRMVERQLRARGIRDERVLTAMERVPRHAFVPADLAEFAYDDSPLPIPEAQTISQPYIVALMAEAALIGPGDRVLEVGTGSGYAAAIFAELAGEVVTIERHKALADGAREVLYRLGYANVLVIAGDGTRGFAERAPYKAILVAAGAPAPPDSLKRQLADGGRLVIPVSANSHQELEVITRRGDHFESESLGAVRFVPLMGEEGWLEHELERGGAGRPAETARQPALRIIAADALPRAIAEAGQPLQSVDGHDVAELVDDVGDARVVLIGEASHGTSEFYRARAAMTRRLIERHGFNVVAVEADWPDATRIDRYVRHREVVGDTEPAFSRFPVWMWRNEEVLSFVEWLRGRNADRPPDKRASFHGLDLYGMSASIAAVIGYLEEVDPEAARVARERYGCLTPWQRDPAAYGRAALLESNRRCERPVLDMLRDLLTRRMEYLGADADAYLDAEGNARLVAAAETYYRTMYYGYADSWNQRDTHMFETLERVLQARGPGAKAVVWAHNSHVGDAAATEMGLVRGEINIGQLARERFGDRAVLIGFGTDRGQVAAATDWGGPMEIKNVRRAHAESYEALFHDSGIPRMFLNLAQEKEWDLGHSLLRPRLERAIGVIYRPESELVSHYFEASLPQQFDRYVWFDV